MTMHSLRIDSKDGIQAAWGGEAMAPFAPNAAGVVPALSAAVPDARIQDRMTRRTSLARSVLRFVRNAAIGLTLLAAVPLTLVTTRGDAILEPTRSSLRERIVDAERFRPLMLERDASITPIAAGTAFRAVQEKQPRSTFDLVPLAGHQRPWRASESGAAPFVDKAPRYDGPAANMVLYRAVEGFNDEQMEWLRKVAEAPIWRDFDRVARAPAVDMIGGQFVLPFRDNAFAPEMRMPNYTDTRELADAGVSRAAYHLARGDHAQARMALSAIVSYGFALVDNASNAMDALVGRTVVDIGRAGFEDYYMATRTDIPAGIEVDHRAFALKPAEGVASVRDAGDVRRRLIANADDPTLSRGLRYESLRALSFASCGNAREMFTGPGADVQDAFARAKMNLARYPSERAYLDLLLDMTNRIPETGPRRLGSRAAVGAATVVGTVLNNPRVAACTRVLMVYR